MTDSWNMAFLTFGCLRCLPGVAVFAAAWFCLVGVFGVCFAGCWRLRLLPTCVLVSYELFVDGKILQAWCSSVSPWIRE